MVGEDASSLSSLLLLLLLLLLFRLSFTVFLGGRARFLNMGLGEGEDANMEVV